MSELVVLKDSLWFSRQKIAGQAVSLALKTFHDRLKSKAKTSLIDIENDSLVILNSLNCTPTFYGFHGFPSKVCLSVNNQLVHGIVTDYVLQESDVVTLDLGATFEGAIADAALTCIYGEPKNEQHIKMLSLCQLALNKSIESIQVGKRLGIIGHTIHKTVKDSGFSLIDKYGGHGIDYDKPHASPFVSNKSSPSEGIRFDKNMSFAIEPMLVVGNSSETYVASDGWTVMSKNIGCHFEHSIFIDEDEKVHIITEHGINYENNSK